MHFKNISLFEAHFVGLKKLWIDPAILIETGFQCILRRIERSCALKP